MPTGPLARELELDDSSQEDLVAFCYSDLTASSSNPTSFARAMSFWADNFGRLLSRGLSTPANALVLRIDGALLEGLRVPDIEYPSGLGVVAQQMERQRVLVPLRDFLDSRARIPPPLDTSALVSRQSWPGWLFSNLVIRPARFAASQIIPFDPSGGHDSVDPDALWARTTAKQDFVFMPLLVRAARSVLEAQRASTERLWTREAFLRDLTAASVGVGVKLSDLDVRVLLLYLSRDLQELVSDKEIIKFRDPLSDEPFAINETDRGVLQVRSTHSRVQQQVAELEKQIAERTVKIGQYVREKRTELAKSHLRSRKQLEELLAKRTNTLETLQTVLLKLDTAASDIQVMQAYESATSTLKRLNAHPSLRNADATLDAMADVLADQKEVEDAISAGSAAARTAGGVEEPDEAELAAELAALEREVQREAERKSGDTPTLPATPTEPIEAARSPPKHADTADASKASEHAIPAS